MRIWLLALAVCASVAHAQPDPCSWLTADQLSHTFNGARFDPPEKRSAPPAYRGQSAGTTCEYSTNRTSKVELTVYVDHSATEARDTFDRLKMFYPAVSKPSGLGDDAYVDNNHGLHVLKGSTRFFMKVQSSYPDRDAQALATIVASKI